MLLLSFRVRDRLPSPPRNTDRLRRLRIAAVLGPLLFLALAPGAATGAVSFTEDSADVDHLQWNALPPFLGPEFMTGGVAVGDFDNDGDPDLFFTRFDAHDLLFENDGSGSFSDVTAGSGLDSFNLKSNGAVWGDVDNDGDLDLYVTTHQDTRYYLFINDGMGVFTEEAVARGADLGGPDLHYGFSASFGDYDGDGFLDLHVTEWRRAVFNPTAAASNTRLLRNLGAANPGHFVDVTVAAGVETDAVPLLFGVLGTTNFTSRFVDLDDDGHLDLTVVSDFGSTCMFWNDGDGTFSDGSVAAGVAGNGIGTAGDENGMGSAVGDYDGDGLLDWFVTAIHDPLDACQCLNGLTGNRLYRNDGNRTFSDETDLAGVRDGGWGWGAAFLDFDNDGDLDLTMNNGQTFNGLAEPGVEAYANDAPRLWRNDAGTMTEVAATLGITTSGSGKAVAVFDYDQDGDQDILYTHNGGRPKLYRNDGGNDNDWLRIRVHGRRGGRDGIGATVSVVPLSGQPARVRPVEAGSGFVGQGDSVVHVGLGAPSALPVHRVTVQWPSAGSYRPTIELSDVSRNQTIDVYPPKAPACGLLGIEALLALAGLHRLRRGAPSR